MELVIRHLSKSYKDNHALVDFCMNLTPGIYALLGPNGAGKSTLINIITGNLPADQGEVLFCGENTQKMGNRFREKLGFMPQYPGMYPNFTVIQFLWYMATLKDIGAGLRGKERHRYVEKEIDSVLTALELADIADRRLGALSGGMKQRLCLAGATLGNPSVIILDEPTAGLDPKQRIAVRNYISRIALNRIVLIATHVVSDIEYIAKEVVFLKKGRIADCGTIEKVTKNVTGKVFSLEADSENVDAISSRCRVVNIMKSEDSDRVTLRILAEEKPFDNAVPVSPTLEDAYLSFFSADAGSADSSPAIIDKHSIT